MRLNIVNAVICYVYKEVYIDAHLVILDDSLVGLRHWGCIPKRIWSPSPSKNLFAITVV